MELGLLRLLRPSELVLTAYFLYVAGASLLLPVRTSIATTILPLNAAVIAAFLAATWADSLRRGRFLSIVRDWYPTTLALLAYREMGWLALPHADTRLENAWVVWDRWLLYDLGLKSVIESLGPLMPSLLELSYSLVYAVAPFSLAALYVCGRRRRVDAFLFSFLLGVVSAYVLFPFFPSEPPRTVFAGQDLPSMVTPFRRFNLGLLGGYGIHTSVFPSAHVSGSMTAALAMLRLLPEKRWIGRGLTILAILIATATVYGRYHYLVDVLAGLGLCGMAETAGRLIYRKRA